VLLDGELWRLFTATVLHGGLMHLALNMLGLWAPGRQLVRQIGHGQFLFVYLASALCGSAASLHFSAQASVSVGASGAVFGVLGALVASSWKYRKELPAMNHKQVWSGPGLFMVYALVQGFGSARVDNAAHVGGLLCGVALGLLLVTRFDARRSAERPSQAALGVLIATAAVVVGVMSTPLPRIWHAPLFEAHAVVRKAGPEFDRIARGLEKFKGRPDDDPELRAYLERDLLRGCAGIQRDLNTIRVPAWEPVAQAASLLGRMCGLMSEAARIGLAARMPQEHAAAERRGAAIVVELHRLAAEMKALNAAGKEKKK
jgi:rhomboid protease GluP